MKKLSLALYLCLSVLLFSFGEDLLSYLDTRAVSPEKKNIRAIEEWSFAYSDLASVNIPEGITVIGKGAFANNALCSVALPQTLQTVNEWAFAHNNIVSVIFPENVVFIGDYAFLGNGLADVTLGDHVYVAQNAIDRGFYECYTREGEREGHYILKNGVWSRELRE